MIIKCNECGHIVSDKAMYCPECGCPIDGQTHSDASDTTPKPSTSQAGAEAAAAETARQSRTSTAGAGTSTTSQGKKPHQYKYYYKPKKNRWCLGCFIAVLVVALLTLVAAGALVYGCVDYVANFTTSTDIPSIYVDEDTIEAEEYVVVGDDDTVDYSEPDDEPDTTLYTEQDDPTVTLHGFIGGTTYTITMMLHILDDGDVTAQYFYDNQGSSNAINLTGNYQPPYLTIYETTVGSPDQAPYFEGKYDGDTYAGSYTNARGEEFAFTLKVDEP